MWSFNMASWFDSLFGGCCSRQRPRIEELKATELPQASLKPVTEEDLHSLPSLSAVQEVADPASYSLPQSPIISSPLVPSPPPISQKSTLTSQNSSLDSAFLLLNQMKCGVCEERSTGFCIGCQKRRYCFSCFQSLHNSMHGVHKFVSYAGTVRRVGRGKG
jgi:hypothetical protein